MVHYEEQTVNTPDSLLTGTACLGQRLAHGALATGPVRPPPFVRLERPRSVSWQGAGADSDLRRCRLRVGSRRTRRGHIRRRILTLLERFPQMKGHKMKPLRHRIVIGAASLAGVGLAAGLWLAVAASASSSSPSGGSGSATTVSTTATPPSASGSVAHWVPAGSGPPPIAAGSPHWTPAGSGPPPSPTVPGMASSS